MYKITIVIPIYKVEKYIERCARSLFNQTLDNIEYIFIDDCSPDRSIDILQRILLEYPNRKDSVRIIRHADNKGVAAARNTGIKAAHGRYLIHCDSDDWVESNMYELMYRKAQETKADIVICDWYKVYTNKMIVHHANQPQSPNECVMQILSGKMHGSLWNKLVKRNLYMQYNIQCIEGANYCEDMYVACKLLYNAQSVAYINIPLYYYFKGNDESYTHNQLSKSSQKGLLTICKALRAYFKDDPAMQKALIDNINVKKSNLLFIGDLKYAKKFEKTSISSIIHHPTLPLSRKIALCFYNLHFLLGVKILRFLYTHSH